MVPPCPTHWCIQFGPHPAHVHCSAVRSEGAWQYLTLDVAHANQAQESLGPYWKECKENYTRVSLSGDNSLLFFTKQKAWNQESRQPFWFDFLTGAEPRLLESYGGRTGPIPEIGSGSCFVLEEKCRHLSQSHHRETG